MENTNCSLHSPKSPIGMIFISLFFSLLFIPDIAHALPVECPRPGFGIEINGTSESLPLGCIITTNNPNREGILIKSTGGNAASLLFGNPESDTSSITTTNKNADGLSAEGNSTVEMFNTNITVSGNDSIGLNIQVNSHGEGPQVLFENGSVTTFGNNGHGALVEGAGILNINNSIIDANGNNANGLMINSAGYLNAAHTHIIARSDNTAGAMITGGLLTLSDSTVDAYGANAPSIQLTPSLLPLPIVQARNTVLNSMSGPTLLANGNGISTILFDGVVNNSGAGVLLNATSGSNIVNFAASNSRLSGDVIVSGLNTANMAFINNTEYTGAMNTRGMPNSLNIFIDNTSIWNVTENSVVDNLINHGDIVFAPPTPAKRGFTTITVNGNYFANSGLLVNTVLEGDHSPSDQLIINGGFAFGTTHITVESVAGEGALTLQNGILLVSAINGGVTGSSAFLTESDIETGIFTYSLFSGGVDGTQPHDWFLRSTVPIDILPPTPVPPSEITSEILTKLNLPPNSLRPGLIPNIRPVVSLYTAIPSVGLKYTQTVIDSMHHRLYELYPMLMDSANTMNNTNSTNAGYSAGDGHLNTTNSESYMNGGWIRVIGNDGKQKNGTIFKHGPNFHVSSGALEAGIDIYQNIELCGAADFVGPFTAFGHSKGKVKDAFNRNAGNINYDNYALGLYWTHFAKCGLYLDAIALGSYDKVYAFNYRPGSFGLKTKGGHYGASLELGYPIDLDFNSNSGFQLTPEAQISYQKLNLKRTQGDLVAIRFKNADSTQGRLGLRVMQNLTNTDIVDNNGCNLIWWLRASGLREFQGNSTTQFTSFLIPFNSNLKGNWVEGEMGISARILCSTFLYVMVTRQQGITRHGSYSNSARLGFNINVS